MMKIVVENDGSLDVEPFRNFLLLGSLACDKIIEQAMYNVKSPNFIIV